jgi:hypothetical protein
MSASYELRVVADSDNGQLLLSSVISMVEPAKIAHISAKCAGKFEFSNIRYSGSAAISQFRFLIMTKESVDTVN